MSKILEEVLRANGEYAKGFGEKSSLALPPARKFAILTCMDARIDPAKLAGLSEGDAHVIRNAGGHASDDAIRSLVISYKLLGTSEWFVIHHSNCSMELFIDATIRGLLASSLETSSYDGKAWKDPGHGHDHGSHHGEFIDWLTIPDQAKSVEIDVERIKSHPLVPKSIPVYGYIYQVESGRPAAPRVPVDQCRSSYVLHAGEDVPCVEGVCSAGWFVALRAGESLRLSIRSAGRASFYSHYKNRG